MKHQTARRGTVVASLAARRPDRRCRGIVACHHRAGGASGEPIRLGILAECEGAFGGFNEDVVAGVTLAMINEAGATVELDDDRPRRLHRSGRRRAADRGRRRRLWRRHA